MANKFEKCDMKNIQDFKDPCVVKKEGQLNDFKAEDVHVFQTGVIIGNVWPNKIKQQDMPTTVVDIKTELSSSEVQCSTTVDNIKVESGISDGGDIKIKCDNGLLLYCEQCNAYYEDYCIECGMLIHILNKNTLDNVDGTAQDELPCNILEIQDSFGQFGVFALKEIPAGVRFGPFTNGSRSECLWKIKGGKSIATDTETTYLNWMRYVNAARNVSEQNLLIFQFEDTLYYKSTRRIQKGDELLVCFGEEYKESLTEDTEIIPLIEDVLADAFACTFCCLGFSSKFYLVKHKTTCLADAAGRFSIEELTQCQFCKIHLDQKEYVKHHVAFCCETNVRKCIPIAPNHRPIEVNQRKTRPHQIYKCEQCKYRTKYKGDLSSHASKHHEIKTCKCRHCNRRFRTKESRKFHMKTAHVCADVSDDTNALIRKHYLRDENKAFKCRLCEFGTKYKWRLKVHIKSKHLRVFDYKCDSCDFGTNDKNLLEYHIKTKHLNEFDYKCDLCQFKTNRKLLFENHRKAKHLKEFDHECAQCSFKTNYKSQLEIHVKVKHLKEYAHGCASCEFRTNRKDRLKSHIKTKHLKEFDYKCDSCSFRTSRRHYLDYHVKKKHLKQFDYKCDRCEYGTSRTNQLEYHMKTKHLNEFDYKCESCAYKTNQKSNLEYHVKTKHLKEFDYKCDTCKYETNVKPNLDLHRKRKHLQGLEFKCDACTYRSHRKTYLEKHIKTKHLKEFDYKCESCDYKTNQKKDIECHVKTKHLKEFDYSCDMCDYRTNQKTNLNNHKKRKHAHAIAWYGRFRQGF